MVCKPVYSQEVASHAGKHSVHPSGEVTEARYLLSRIPEPVRGLQVTMNHAVRMDVGLRGTRHTYKDDKTSPFIEMPFCRKRLRYLWALSR